VRGNAFHETPTSNLQPSTDLSKCCEFESIFGKFAQGQNAFNRKCDGLNIGSVPSRIGTGKEAEAIFDFRNDVFRAWLYVTLNQDKFDAFAECALKRMRNIVRLSLRAKRKVKERKTYQKQKQPKRRETVFHKCNSVYFFDCSNIQLRVYQIMKSALCFYDKNCN
jgi:hypothetical protein